MIQRFPDDPSGTSAPHDILAAEEFAMPLRPWGQFPSDPIHQPHDVLAAEEFAMPTGGVPPATGGGFEPRTLMPAAVLLAALALGLRRLLR